MRVEADRLRCRAAEGLRQASERAACAWWERRRFLRGDRAGHRARMRDRRHEPAAVRAADGEALRRRRAGRVLRAGPDEEESAGHAGHGHRRRRSSRSSSPRYCSPSRRQSASDTRKMLRERLAREVRTSRRRSGANPVQGGDARRPRSLNAAPEFEDCAKAAAERAGDQGCAGPGHEGVASTRRAAAEARSNSDVPFLSDDGDRLREQPAAPGDGVREDRRRRHRPVQAARRFRDALRDGQRRALAERLQEGAGRGAGPARVLRRDGTGVPAGPGHGSTCRSTISSGRRSRGIGRA